MKKIALLFTAFIGIASLQSCEVNDSGDQIFTSEVFEVRADLTRERGYAQTFNFSQPSYQGDTVLLYILWEQNGGQDVWRLVPQTVQLGGGDIVTYNYDFTRNDFRIFLDSNFNLDQMTDQEYTSIALNQIFRAVVVPGNLIQSKGTAAADYSDYYATLKAFGLENAPIKKLK